MIAINVDLFFFSFNNILYTNNALIYSYKAFIWKLLMEYVFQKKIINMSDCINELGAYAK